MSFWDIVSARCSIAYSTTHLLFYFLDEADSPASGMAGRDILLVGALPVSSPHGRMAAGLHGQNRSKHKPIKYRWKQIRTKKWFKINTCIVFLKIIKYTGKQIGTHTSASAMDCVAAAHDHHAHEKHGLHKHDQTTSFETNSDRRRSHL